MANTGTRFIGVISGRSSGPHYGALRAVLCVASVFYRVAIEARNAWFNRVAASRQRASAPVISIGNITVGGTGKTPVTCHIAALLIKRGRKAGILTRGYKGRGPLRPSTIVTAHDPSNTSDEALVLRRRCPEAVVVVDPDRVRGAARAVEQGADVLLMDDGFQHRRLARDLDIVLIDATRPFGFDRMLPRGLLREPIRALRRADIIVLTRSDLIDDSDKRLLKSRLKRVSGDKPVIEARHRLVAFADVHGKPVGVADPGAMQAVVFAGIANFDGFVQSVEQIGVKALAAYEYPDHHAYSDEEIAALQDVAATLEANVLLTTEKDAVKFANRWKEGECRLLVPKLEVEFDPCAESVLFDAIDRAIAQGVHA